MATRRDGNHGMTRLQQVKLFFLVLILLATLFQWSLIFRFNLQAKQGGGHLASTFLLQSFWANNKSATETNTVHLKGTVGTTSASHISHTVGVDQNPRKEKNSINKYLADSNHTSRGAITPIQSTQKTTTVAYAISVTSCPVNQSHIVLDGAAVLGHSIHLHSIRSTNTSRYDYALFAFVHADAQACTAPLRQLGYQVQIKTELPFNVSQASPSLLDEIEKQGCCGSKEFLKLYVYSLTEYPLAIHLDTDTLVVQPMDELFDSLLLQAGDEHRSLPEDHVASIQHHHPHHHGQESSSSNSSSLLLRPGPSINFLFTRDYHQQSRASKNPKHYGVQGGFLLVRPNQTFFDELTSRLSREEFDSHRGWSNRSYAGYWGAPQIQGFLAYVYGEYYPEQALELNRCRYNSMINDEPFQKKGKQPTTCRTLEEASSCEDCRETPWEDIYLVHLTTCRKPWECPHLRPPHPKLCQSAHRAWFETRRHLEVEQWKQSPPRGGWNIQWTLGYCARPPNSSKREYRRMELPVVVPKII